jgi:hypothetical protein
VDHAVRNPAKGEKKSSEIRNFDANGEDKDFNPPKVVWKIHRAREESLKPKEIAGKIRSNREKIKYDFLCVLPRLSLRPLRFQIFSRRTEFT